jgi:hypothetical protein
MFLPVLLENVEMMDDPQMFVCSLYKKTFLAQLLSHIIYNATSFSVCN